MELKRGWICVWEDSDIIKAELLKAMLAEHQIEAVIINKQDSAYGIFGRINIMVSDQDVPQAIVLIKTENFNGIE